MLRHINTALENITTGITGNRRIGQGKIIEQVLSARVDAIGRDDIAGKLDTRHRVKHDGNCASRIPRLRKVTDPLQRCRHSYKDRISWRDSVGLLEIEKEECLVL